MALLPWDDEDEKRKELLGQTPIKQVASVQDSSWQPAASGADSAVATDGLESGQGGVFANQPQPVAAQPQQTNYLMSEEHGQAEQQKAKRDAEIEAARQEQEQARQRAEAAAAVSQNFKEGKNAQGETLNVDEIKKDQGWKKYYDKAFEDEKKGMGFWDKLMDGGQASRRAETIARSRYNNELIQKAWDENGNLLDENAALQARKLAAYNKALAEDNSNRSLVLARAIGATKDNEGSGFMNRLKNAINAEKQMNVGSAIFGVDDTQKTDWRDAGRFGGGLVQGFATMIPIGLKELKEAGTGHGTSSTTGFEDDLSTGERVGRGISGGLNVVTPFVGGSGKFLDSFTTKAMTKGLTETEGRVATQLASRVLSGGASEAEEKIFASLAAKAANNAATQAEKSALAKLTSSIVLPSLEQGAIGGTQAGAEYFGNGGTLTDENGNLDMDKVQEFLKQTGEATATGVAGGMVLSGAGAGVRRLRNRNGRPIPTLSDGELAELETGTTNSSAAQLENMRAANAEPNLQALEGMDVTPVETPVADGIATPDAPNIDQPTPVAEGTAVSQNADVTPGSTLPAASTPDLLTSDVTPADGVAQTVPADVAPVRDPVIETPVETPVTPETPAPADVAPANTTTVSQAPGQAVVPVRDRNTPAVSGEDLRALQESRAGKNQADEAAINQELANAETATPAVDSLPDDLSRGSEIVDPTPLTPAQVVDRLMPKLADNSDVKQRIADAAGVGKDAASPVEDILAGAGVKQKTADRITKHFNDLEEQVQRYNRLTEENQRAYAEGGTENLDESISRERSRAAREMGTTTRRLMQEIKRMEGGRDHKVALINGLTDIIGTRNANVLTSAGLLERNIFQEITANLKLAAKNPIKMAKSTFMNGNILKDTAKGELSHWGDMPSWKKPVEIVKYVVGNTYRTGMIPTTALANTRRGAVRDELTKWAFQELEGRKVSSKEAHKLSGTAGNEMEALVNTFTGVDNGMTNRKQAMDALKAWKEYIRTGDDGAKAEFLSKVEQHDSLADQMIAGLSKEDQVRARGLMALKNLIFPFVRTATNLAKNTVRQDLNPFARSLLDEIRVDQRSGGANTINLIKSKLVDYGIMSGAAALASSGAIVYNDGDEVDKPKGWSLKIGDNEYIPVRATSLELPIAMAGAAQAMASDIAEGKPQDWKHYAGMITGSLPYIDQFNQTTGAVDSLAGMGDENGDQGYAAKSYAVNTIKSFVPGSNNGVQAYVAGKQGESLNAKTVYDKNFGTWLQNSIQKSYDPEFYNGLKDSRDNAGRVRTVDNQGVISNKTINDASTAEFNQRITDLVDYGRKAGLGKNTQDMFNTYDTGKNNNFKSIQDSITFLDVPDGGKPDNTKKLEKNEKLTNLSQQMRDGFFGDSGNELLTLDGKNLYSDVSVPNGAGSKNSRLPISMASIRNAVAQTDLPAGDRERMKQISDQDSALYDQLKAKQITYEQYTAEKAKTGAEYQRILSNSPSYQKMLDLFDELDSTGFFEANGLGSTKSGQTYLWNSLNALLGSKGATPAANFPDTSKGWTPWNRGTGRTSNSGGNLEGGKGVQFTPVTARQLAAVKAAQFTPFKVKVKLGNEIKRDRSQNYSDRSF